MPLPLRLLIVSTVIAGMNALQAEVSFNRQIKPLISDNCFKCHGPDAKNQDSEFRLDTAEHAYADLGGYFGIVPGQPAQSELVKRLHSQVEDELMPPADSNLALSDAEKKLLEQWIREGAKFEPHWSLQKLPVQVAVPAPTQFANWAKSPIDQFIAAGFAAYGVGPAAETAP